MSELRLSLDNQTTCESAAESQIPPSIPSAPTLLGDSQSGRFLFPAQTIELQETNRYPVGLWMYLHTRRTT